MQKYAHSKIDCVLSNIGYIQSETSARNHFLRQEQATCHVEIPNWVC
jgi:hypothetical protein